jgi:NitT/TauT family transport system substrate-binding protein
MDAQTFSDSAHAQASLIKTPDTQLIGAMSSERWQTLVDQLSQLKAIKGAVVTKDLYAIP